MPLSSVSLKYFDLPAGLAGRGGGLRFFLLAAGVDFKEEVLPWDGWGSSGARQAVIDSGESPEGVLPVLTVDGKQHLEHIATSRLLARKLGLYAAPDGDEAADYAADCIADQYANWRDLLIETLSSESAKEAYQISKRAEKYRVLEAMLARYGSTASSAVAGGRLRYSDALLFSVAVAGWLLSRGTGQH